MIYQYKKIFFCGAGLLLATMVHAREPLWTYSAPTPARVTVFDGGVATVQYTVTNRARKPKNLKLKTTSGLGASSCYLSGRGATCTFTLTINGSLISQNGLHTGPVMCEKGNMNQCYQPSSKHALQVIKNTRNTASLQLSINELALKVNGVPRTITITNTGSTDAVNVGYTLSPSLPSDAKITPSSCGTIKPSKTCVLTITPGAKTTATPGDLNPVPVSARISGANTNTVHLAINIVTFGSVYQGGYIFSINDTVPPGQSVKGKVLAKTYQAKRYPGGITWGAMGTVVEGVNDSDTAGVNSCDGKNDGVCNTKRIIARLTDSSPHLPLASYAAGLCKKMNNNKYTDWYLPAVCEMGFMTSAPGCASGTESIVINLQDLLGTGTNDPNDDPDKTCTYAASYSDTVCLAGAYWSSTQYSVEEADSAWVQIYIAGEIYPPDDNYAEKDLNLGVRCTRNF